MPMRSCRAVASRRESTRPAHIAHATRASHTLTRSRRAASQRRPVLSCGSLRRMAMRRPWSTWSRSQEYISPIAGRARGDERQAPRGSTPRAERQRVRRVAERCERSGRRIGVRKALATKGVRRLESVSERIAWLK